MQAPATHHRLVILVWYVCHANAAGKPCLVVISSLQRIPCTHVLACTTGISRTLVTHIGARMQALRPIFSSRYCRLLRYTEPLFRSDCVAYLCRQNDSIRLTKPFLGSSTLIFPRHASIIRCSVCNHVSPFAGNWTGLSHEV